MRFQVSAKRPAHNCGNLELRKPQGAAVGEQCLDRSGEQAVIPFNQCHLRLLYNFVTTAASLRRANRASPAPPEQPTPQSTPQATLPLTPP